MDQRSGVGRRPQPERREELQRALVEYVLAHGIADLSLRPLAGALGMSTYALIYHFGSKEGVLAAALSGAEEQLRMIVADWSAHDAPISPAGLLRRLWDLFSSEQLDPYLRLFFEAYGLALRDSTRLPGFLERGAAPWTSLIHDIVRGSGIPESEAESTAMLIVAATNGMQLELLASGDRPRTTRAIEQLATYLESGSVG